MPIRPYETRRLTADFQVPGLRLPAGREVFIVSIHREHVRAAVEINGVSRRIRVPKVALPA